MKEAPIFIDAYQVALELARLKLEPPDTGAHARALAVELLEALTLALKGFDTPERLHDADVLLVRLRLTVRLLIDLSDRPALIALTEPLDKIGRQLGGWRRHLMNA
ncbi:MAG: hypothetical protein AAF449_20150 [Myxococcota bacterium]